MATPTHQQLLEARHIAAAHGMNIVDRLATDGGTRFALYRGPVRYHVHLGLCATPQALLSLVERYAQAIQHRRRRTSSPSRTARSPR